MGIFGSSKKKQKKTEEYKLGEELSQQANAANDAIGGLLTSFKNDLPQFDNLPAHMLNFSERVLSKLSDKEMAELVALTDIVCELHQNYFNKYRRTDLIWKKQNERTKNAVARFSELEKK
ncbi:MAG: hypothetical protein WBG71_10015 [Leeuwenhoekiella sp.]